MPAALLFISMYHCSDTKLLTAIGLIIYTAIFTACRPIGNFNKYLLPVNKLMTDLIVI